MKALEPNPSTNETHKSWHPLLDLASHEVFELMLGSHLDASPEPVSNEGLDAAAMVGLAGLLCGMLTVRCKSQAAVQMASKMLGTDSDKAGPETWDALGEVCNMVAGNFKIKIPRMGDECMLSVPTVITGADYACHSLGLFSTLKSSFLFEGQPIVITLQIHS